MLAQPTISLWICIPDNNFDLEDLNLQNQLTGEWFKKENGLPCVLPIGTMYSACSENSETAIWIKVTRITYIERSNDIEIELRFKKKTEVSDREIAAEYLLNPAHGWVMVD